MSMMVVMAKVVDTVLKASTPWYTTAILGAVHAEEAAKLLAYEFCRREPLCRQLGLTEVEILPFFRQMLRHLVKQGLSVVLLDRLGRLKGAAILEEHLDQFQPDFDQIPEGLAVIGAYLDQVKLPKHLEPSAPGHLYYSGLIALDGRTKNPKLLPLLMMAAYTNLRNRGYTHGYAKVTNRAVTRRFRTLEKFALRPVFTAHPVLQPAEFCLDGRYPFAAYRGETSLLSWVMA